MPRSAAVAAGLTELMPLITACRHWRRLRLRASVRLWRLHRLEAAGAWGSLGAPAAEPGLGCGVPRRGAVGGPSGPAAGRLASALPSRAFWWWRHQAGRSMRSRAEAVAQQKIARRLLAGRVRRLCCVWQAYAGSQRMRRAAVGRFRRGLVRRFDCSSLQQ